MNYFFKKNKIRQNKNRGQAILIVVIMCTAIFLAIVLGVVEPVTNELRLSGDLLRSKASFYTAESGSEDAVFRVKNSLITSYPALTYIVLNEYSSTTTIPSATGLKTIQTTGSDNRNFRNLETKVASGVGTRFDYGVQAGAGGMSLTGGGWVNGSVYSNGPLNVTSGVTITGNVTASTIGPGELNVGTTTGYGDAWAHSASGVDARGTIYCQTGSENTPSSCDTSRGDPPQKDLPITNADIQKWKDFAATGSTYIGNFGATSTTIVGPMKIVGNLVVNGDDVLTLTGVVWVTGNITFSNSAKLRLASGYGTSGGVLLADGTVALGGDSLYAGSDTPGSYPVIVSTSNSSSAINVTGGAGAVVLVALSGTINLSGGTGAQAVAANRVVIGSGGTINYDSSLANFSVSSGLTDNVWGISGWKEVQ